MQLLVLLRRLAPTLRSEEPRERYQEGGSKVIAAGFVFALETLGF